MCTLIFIPIEKLTFSFLLLVLSMQSEAVSTAPAKSNAELKRERREKQVGFATVFLVLSECG